MDTPRITTEQIVQLNIGGYTYTTTKQTLCGKSENFFTSLLSERVPTIRDEKGRYFIDRDGKYFEPILEYLRTGELVIPDGLSQHSVFREAEFYSIDLPQLDTLYKQLQLSNIQIRQDGVYFNKQLTSSYSFGAERGMLNLFNNISIEFNYVLVDAILTLSFDKAQVQRQKRVLLVNPQQELLLDPNSQQEPYLFFPCNKLREGVIYEGLLDISKEGKSRNLAGFFFLGPGTVYLNISEDDGQVGQNRVWKKGSYKMSKFINLISVVVSIPLDPLDIEIIAFGAFAAVRIRRTNNHYFVVFSDFAEHSEKHSSQTELPTMSDIEAKKVGDKKEESRKKLLPIAKSFKRSTSFSMGLSANRNSGNPFFDSLLPSDNTERRDFDQ